MSQTSPSATQGRVSLFDPGYRPPTDWKFNIGLSGVRAGRWEAQASLRGVHEVNATSTVDLNFSAQPQFVLSDGFRPVFTSPNEISGSTGLINPGVSRIDPAIGHLQAYRSDLSRDAFQFSATIVSPDWLRAKLGLTLTYLFDVQRNEGRGYLGTTAGYPDQVERLPGAQPTHQFVIANRFPLRLWVFNSNIRFVLTSGIAYTPMVVGDINGDGYSNDRAFIPNLAQSASGTLASSLNEMLAQAPSGVRACILEQQRRIAAANSCRGPWSGRLDWTMTFASSRNGALGQRLHFTMNLINAGSLIGRALGLDRAALTGAGMPDSRLLYLSGFDPGLQQFRYTVNPLFGQTLTGGVNSRAGPPVQLQVALEYQLAAAPLNPLLHEAGLDRGRGKNVSLEAVVAALGPYASNPVDVVLWLKDSLALSSEQVRQVEAVKRAIDQAIDSLRPRAAMALFRDIRKLTDNDFRLRANELTAALQPIRDRARTQILALLTKSQIVILDALRGQKPSFPSPIPRAQND